MLATFMVILDTSIVVVALPYIAGNLGATQDESTWVLTSYLVANAVILPASAWFSEFFRAQTIFGRLHHRVHVGFADLRRGRRACRCWLLPASCKGLGGGAMQPLSQAILLESFPPAKRGAATRLVRPRHRGCPHRRPHAWAAG